jgi:hypothetical protein
MAETEAKRNERGSSGTAETIEDLTEIGRFRRNLFNRMEQKVEIPVEIRGMEQVFAARLQTWRYGQRFLVDIYGVEVTIERDNAGEFRAVLPEGFTGHPPDKEVIRAIIDVLRAL